MKLNENYTFLKRIKLIFYERGIDISQKIHFFKGDLRDKKFIDSDFDTNWLSKEKFF